MLLEVRWHGRGGQGAVTAAEILAQAAIEEGLHAQAMPSFGPERRGAPVQAFNRISDKPIRTRGVVKRPDVVIVIDEGLVALKEVLEGMKEGSKLVTCSSKPAKEVKRMLGLQGPVASVDAIRIALETLGASITNTPMLGAFVKAVGIVSLGAVVSKVEERFGAKLGPKNAEAVRRAYEATEVA
ncbi:MAG: 2-oxoacid:acceptor oxidoreductase family protein [Candidatus Nezhaarchaeota archaeon]|nr:2-oxoacid:acceptor oxidoreductase family protein [Candidatus Nezhaarchaeota archaeon]